MKIKSLLSNITLVFTGILLTLFILEFITRVIFDEKIVLFPRYHSEVQYGDFHIRRIRPNSVFWHTSQDGQWKFVTNSQGFRNTTDFNYAKPDTLVRIICLGDSHTEGFEVRQDHTFSSVLEKELRSLGKPTEVYNMGVSGYGTDEELILFENEAVKYKPDYIVVGFFANDYEDNLKTGLFSLEDSNLINVRKENLPGVKILEFINQFYLIRKLSEHSYLYSFCFNSVWDFIKAARVEKAKEGARALDTTHSYAIAVNRTRTQKELQLTTKLLERLFNSAREHGVRIIFVDIPQDDLENSLDRSMGPFVESNVDVYITGSKLVEPFKLHIDTHAPHGHRHISEFTHMVIGLEIAKAINRDLKMSSIK
ncbi:SGNH/GDSL hydrolase family protein [bacterium]|nr:SGNH/GDSL hydrolase family protein [bacterium]